MPDFQDILSRTLDDGRVSRGERKALRALVADLPADEVAAIRRIANDLARDRAPDKGSRDLIGWLEDVGRALDRPVEPVPMCEILLSPGDDCRERIRALLDASSRSVDVCVYTITDDRISRKIADAHARGVAVRVISDDEKAHDLGSDLTRFRTLGIPVRFDDAPYQMHHKFAVFDGRTAVTGSYNWTRTAAEQNQENLVVSDDPRLVRTLADEFERLWKRFC